MTIAKHIIAAVQDHFSVPAHIQACAAAVRYDLLHGPAWAKIPPEGVKAFTADHFATFPEDLDDVEGELVQVYDSDVANALREFIQSLPTLYVDEDGCTSEFEPQGEWLEAGPDYVEVSGRWLVRALFGDTIGQEFDY